jgi:hypothetical protein
MSKSKFILTLSSFILIMFAMTAHATCIHPKPSDQNDSWYNCICKKNDWSCKCRDNSMCQCGMTKKCCKNICGQYNGNKARCGGSGCGCKWNAKKNTCDSGWGS